MKGTIGKRPPNSSYGVKNKKSSFPTPKFKRVFDTDRSKKAVTFFEYWAKLPPEFIEFCRVKVFRTWPQIDVRLVDPDKKDISVDAFDGAITFEAADYLHFFLERYSSGSWNCQLYDISTEGGPEKIIECFFDAQDLYTKKENGEDKYPVRVDLRTVQWGKTHNRNFEEYLRARNIPIPGQEGVEYEEAKEMNAGITATSELAKSAMERSDRLAAENGQILRELVETKIESNHKREDSSPSAISKTVEMMADAGKAAVTMVKESATQPAFNPLELVKEVFTMSKNNDTSAVMMQMFITSMEKQNQAMVKMHEDTLSYMKTRDATQAVTVAPKGIFDMIAEEGPKLESVKNFMGWGGRRHDESAPPVMEARSQWLEKLVEKPENLQAVVGLFALASNMLATILGKGKPAEEVLQNAGVVPAPVSNGNVAAANPPAAEPPRQPTQAELNQMFLEFLEPVFLEHFFDNQKRGLDGSTFAKALLSIVQTPDGTQWAAGPETPVGRQQYGLISSDPKGFDRLLRSYSPIWGQVSAYAIQQSDSKTPPKYFQFLNDFFNYDHIAKV